METCYHMATMNANRTQPLRMLVVDDDETFRLRLQRALQTRGHDVHAARNGQEAIALVKRIRPQRAVVDLRMPGRSGLELVRELSEMSEDLRIVVLTGYGSIATAVEAVKSGAIDYLTKPADTDQILQAFERHESGLEDTTAPETVPSLARVEYEHIQRILTDCNGNISQAARVLGIHRRSLQRKLGKLPPFE